MEVLLVNNLTTTTLSPAVLGTAPDTTQYWIHKVQGRICAFEYEGSIKYYPCRRHEYCCGVGCCVNPAFAFYQLWYFWLMVIMMFMLCSGGGWWYRSYHWTHLGNTPEPIRSNRRRHSPNQRNAPVRLPHAFMSSAFARDAATQHHVAPPYRNGWNKEYPGYHMDPENPPPPYSTVAPPIPQMPPQCSQPQQTTSAVIPQVGSSNEVPPPSYEFVMKLKSETENNNATVPVETTEEQQVNTSTPSTDMDNCVVINVANKTEVTPITGARPKTISNRISS